ncbi:MAG: ABC transporter substrate-binding protein [Burkholderiales bacterium]
MNTDRRHVLTGAAAAVGASLLGAPGLLLAQGQPVRIGVALPLSGPLAFLGNEYITGIKLAVAQYNKDGGLLGRQIELVVRDDKFSGAGAVAAARELSGMGVNLLLAGANTGPTLALLPILEEIKTVLISISAQTLSITHELYTRYMFRNWANNYMATRGFARSSLQQYRGAKRWQPVISDNAFGRDAAKMFGDAVKDYYPQMNAGGQAEILAPMLVGATQADFQLQINQLLANPADGYFLALPGASGITFLRQSKQLGLDKRWKCLVDVSGDAIAKSLGNDIPANLWSFTAWPFQGEPLKSNKGSQQTLSDYTALTGDRYPSSYAAMAWRAARVLFEGVKRAKSTETAAVIEGIEGVKFESLGGTLTVRKEDHQVLATSFYARVTPVEAAPKWTLSDLITIPDAALVEPASPGRPFAV